MNSVNAPATKLLSHLYPELPYPRLAPPDSQREFICEIWTLVLQILEFKWRAHLKEGASHAVLVKQRPLTSWPLLATNSYLH